MRNIKKEENSMKQIGQVSIILLLFMCFGCDSGGLGCGSTTKTYEGSIFIFGENPPIYTGEEDLVIQNEADMQAFSEAGYTHINGGIQINGSNFKDLKGLENIRYVQNGLFIQHNYQLISLDGLDNLEDVEYINIQRNDALTRSRNRAWT